MKLVTENRQSIQTSFLILAVLLLSSIVNAQEKKAPPIDYSIKSNILNPDTLKGDQKRIFWHFVKLTNKQAKDLKPLQIKAEFEKLGITTNERARFVKALSFFDCTMTNHKESCEQWESFKDLAPETNK